MVVLVGEPARTTRERLEPIRDHLSISLGLLIEDESAVARTLRMMLEQDMRYIKRVLRRLALEDVG